MNDLQLLLEANEAYHNGQSIISDAHFDAIWDRLTARLASDPTGPDSGAIARALAAVGAAPRSTSWRKVKHTIPMGSLFKAKDIGELVKWIGSLSASTALTVTHKCDGISVQCSYANGVLWQALTRGDGETGEDITRNVLKMKGIKPYIEDFSGHLRGEIMLTKTDHALHFPNYANTRNAAAGIAKREDGEGCEHLTVVFYKMVPSGPVEYTKKWRELDIMRFDLDLPYTAYVGSFNRVEDIIRVYHDYISSAREDLNIDIDGLVLEVDELKVFESLGETNGRPKGAIALKFPAAIETATLQSVQWQTGRSGRITPVAYFTAVNIVGATITQASLHNIAYMRRLAEEHNRPYMQLGDRLLISRRNDVIPYVEEVHSPNRNGEYCTVPESCPSCSGDLNKEGEYLQCRNIDCPAQLVGAIARWVTKLGIKGYGESIIVSLIDNFGVEDPSDLYRLDPDEVSKATHGDGNHLIGRTAYTLFEALHAKKTISLATLLSALGIPMCSKTVCRSIVDAGYGTLAEIQAMTFDDLVVVPGLGSARANSFYAGVRDNQMLLSRLLAGCVKVSPQYTGPLTGTTVCFTGIRAPDLERQLEKLGCTVKTSVVQDLTYLVQADPHSTSGKSVKARKQGTTLLTLEGMRSVITSAEADAALADIDEDVDF